MQHSSFLSGLKQNSLQLQHYPFQSISCTRLMELARDHGVTAYQAQILALENKVLPQRYLRNFSSLSLKDQLSLARSHILIVGMGGLGGYILELLARSGVGSFILADGDRFEESNFNRQLLGTVDTIEALKVNTAETRLEQINPLCRCRSVSRFLGRDDLPELLKSADLAVDALGGIEFRPVLMQEASRAGLPLVTGFVAGTTGLASTVYPGGKNPSLFWQGNGHEGAENTLGNMAPIVSLIASVQADEVIRILTGKNSGLADKVFLADLQTLTFDLLEL